MIAARVSAEDQDIALNGPGHFARDLATAAAPPPDRPAKTADGGLAALSVGWPEKRPDGACPSVAPGFSIQASCPVKPDDPGQGGSDGCRIGHDAFAARAKAACVARLSSMETPPESKPAYGNMPGRALARRVGDDRVLRADAAVLICNNAADAGARYVYAPS